MPPLTLTYSPDAVLRLNEGGGGRATATGVEGNSIFIGEKRCNSEKMITFAPDISIERNIIMARPIKETPILYGEEARKFETRMMNPPRLPAEQIERMQRDYEFMRSRCVNCTF